MGIKNYLKGQYEATLEKKYNEFKAFLEQDTFVPDAAEVWKMYGRAFNENNGIYAFAVELLELELCDNNGRLNELHIILDNINHKLSDYCSAYVAGMQKQNRDN